MLPPVILARAVLTLSTHVSITYGVPQGQESRMTRICYEGKSCEVSLLTRGVQTLPHIASLRTPSARPSVTKENVHKYGVCTEVSRCFTESSAFVIGISLPFCKKPTWQDLPRRLSTFPLPNPPLQCPPHRVSSLSATAKQNGLSMADTQVPQSYHLQPTAREECEQREKRL